MYFSRAEDSGSFRITLSSLLYLNVHQVRPCMKRKYGEKMETHTTKALTLIAKAGVYSSVSLVGTNQHTWRTLANLFSMSTFEEMHPWMKLPSRITLGRSPSTTREGGKHAISLHIYLRKRTHGHETQKVRQQDEKPGAATHEARDDQKQPTAKGSGVIRLVVCSFSQFHSVQHRTKERARHGTAVDLTTNNNILRGPDTFSKMKRNRMAHDTGPHTRLARLRGKNRDFQSVIRGLLALRPSHHE